MKTKIANEAKNLPLDNGIAENDRAAIAEALSRLLADTHVLYLKTHNYHWNVTGPMFQTLHLMFETQYNELWTATDLIAERIRALGYFAPGTYKEYAKLAVIEEEDSVPAAADMIRRLVEGNDAASRTARAGLKIAEDANDAPTADLLTQRLQIHEKTAWMLRSLLAD
jgi:starvation-inducible DNA-binding protein